ncbi:hypothetical protein [Novosphingobium huizhouense]|uniref:hypothetical protein n=1 Tax=Novosphingobium huizhouense TaxID=2866625 RepID=UPI001CD8D4D7|nr:hypothetical protein [Novosphingobium huizhouense]
MTASTTRPVRSQAFINAYRTASAAAERMDDHELRRAFVAAEEAYNDDGRDNTAQHGRFRAFEGEMDHRDAYE